MLNSKNRVLNPDFLKRYLSNETNPFADNLRVETIIFLMEKLSFSLKLVSGHFYGQSYIKSVRGPWLWGNINNAEHMDRPTYYTDFPANFLDKVDKDRIYI